MPWGYAVGAIGSSLIGGMFSHSGQKSANQMNLQIARENNKWMERMANTEMQRRVSDLQKAGLNPMLAYDNGASTPQLQQPVMQNEYSGAGDAARGISSALMAITNLKNIEADTQLKAASAKEVDSRTLVNQRNADKIHYESQKLQDETREIRTDINLKEFLRDKIQPLQEAKMKFENDLIAAKIEPAEAEARFWKMLQDANGSDTWFKVVMALKSLLK